MGILKKGQVNVKVFSSQEQAVQICRRTALGCIKVLGKKANGSMLMVVLSLYLVSTFIPGLYSNSFQAAAQDDSLSKIRMPQSDSLSKISDTPQGDSISKPDNTAQADSAIKSSGMAPDDQGSASMVSSEHRKDTVSKTGIPEFAGLTNISLSGKKIKANGWGEYRVGGRCLCCDNTNDGDCIVVRTIERTDRERIPQIIDGKIEGDTSDRATYFGNVQQREAKEPVSLLMVEISLGKMQEVRKVLVYTLFDKAARINFLSNCELGYTDQFGRLQWVGMGKSETYDKPVVFDLEHPVLTKMITLRSNNGKNRITEVAIFAADKKE
jgi:hypothetical protein